MNIYIDLGQLKSFLRDNENNTYDLIGAIEDCEIKVNCADCAYFDEDLVEKCLSCINYDHVDNFKPKQSELDNLFVGAPVVQVGTENGAFVRILNFDGNKEYKRLPTVAEAPRNVWLAPWVKFPEGLRHLKYILRHKNDVFTDTKWSEVEAVMILEDLKK